MKMIHILVGVSVLTLLLGAACATSTQSAVKDAPPLALPSPTQAAAQTQTTPQSSDPADSIPRTKPAEAVQLVSKNEAILVDVRDVTSFDTMHAKGALHVSYQEISEGKLDKLPKNKHLILYCT